MTTPWETAENLSATEPRARRLPPLLLAPLLMALLLLALLGGCSGVSGAGENSVLHYFQRGNEAFAAEDYRRAIIHYRNALALEPGAPDLHYNLGLAYYRAGDYRSAVRAYLNAIELDANFPNAHHNLALAYNKLYRPGMAHQAYNTYRKLSSPAAGKAKANKAKERNVRAAKKAPAMKAIPGLPPGLNIKQATAAKPRRQAAPSNPYQGKRKWWTLDPAKTDR